VGLKLNGTHHLLPYGNEVILLGDNIGTINGHTETLIDASKKVGIEGNIEKTNYMSVPHDQNADLNLDIKIKKSSYEQVSKFRYLETTVTNQNCIQEEIKRILNSGNACYHSVQNLLSSRLLLKNVKVRIYKTIILPVVLYGCETWSLTLKEKHKLRVFENRVRGGWRKLHNEELDDLYSSPSIIRIIKSRIMRWAVHVAQMGEKKNMYRLLVGKPRRKRPV
jgi:hypothetical protein